jgi:hypothetical protein
MGFTGLACCPGAHAHVLCCRHHRCRCLVVSPLLLQKVGAQAKDLASLTAQVKELQDAQSTNKAWLTDLSVRLTNAESNTTKALSTVSGAWDRLPVRPVVCACYPRQAFVRLIRY